MSRALDRRLGVGHALVRVAEGESPELERLPGLRLLATVAAVPDPVGERLQPRLARGERAVLLLLPVRMIEVLERVGIEGVQDPLAQLGRQGRVATDRLEDDGLARAHPGGELAGFEHAPHRLQLEPEAGFAAVAADERGRRASCCELEHGARRRHRDLGVAGGEPGVEGGGQRVGHGGSGAGTCCHVRASAEKTRFSAPVRPVGRAWRRGRHAC
jgi:hypothetical protein